MISGLTPRRIMGMLAILLVLAADQVSKWWILNGLDLPRLRSVELLPMLSFTMVWNRGVTFGLLSGDGMWTLLALTGVALAVVAALVVWLWRAERTRVALALGSIAGGAVGNVIDRLRFGAVVDFIHAHAWGWSWYVFNVADAAIVCGVAVLVLDSLSPAGRAPSDRAPSGQPTHTLARDPAPR
jgi:signal peptidase II